jgi:DNA replication and repair protein RecF
MFFSSLRTVNFRNLSDTETITSSKDVFLVGENGQGKTNFLEALYFCAYASSFRGVSDNELACSVFRENSFHRKGEKDFSVAVKIEQSVNDEILVKIENEKKRILINGKNTEDRKELLSIAPCIVFCHEDMEFINGSPEKRRWFFDQTLSLYDPVYLEDLRKFKKVLKSRNSILRDFVRRPLAEKDKNNVEQVLEALDSQFILYGQRLTEKRETAAKHFSDIFMNLYEEVSHITGINVQYVQSWKSEKDLTVQLREKRTAEMACGLSLLGPHRDRYVFAHNRTEFTVKASTGQKRLLALLLRTAQAKRFSEMTGQKPVLLLDDVLLEMDGEKRQRFISVLPDYDQAFFTFLPEEPYKRYCKEDTLIYNVYDGQLKRL